MHFEHYFVHFAGCCAKVLLRSMHFEHHFVDFPEGKMENVAVNRAFVKHFVCYAPSALEAASSELQAPSSEPQSSGPGAPRGKNAEGRQANFSIHSSKIDPIGSPKVPQGSEKDKVEAKIWYGGAVCPPPRAAVLDAALAKANGQLKLRLSLCLSLCLMLNA